MTKEERTEISMLVRVLTTEEKINRRKLKSSLSNYYNLDKLSDEKKYLLKVRWVLLYIEDGICKQMAGPADNVFVP